MSKMADLRSNGIWLLLRSVGLMESEVVCCAMSQDRLLQEIRERHPDGSYEVEDNRIEVWEAGVYKELYWTSPYELLK